MRSIALVLSVFFSLAGGSAVAQDAAAAAQVTPNTWRLPKEATRPAAKVADAAWLVGSWTGTGLGGEVDELWLPPRDGAMHGVFRLQKDGKLSFSEFMTIAEVDGSLILRIKHFTPAFVGWEEKDRSVDFRFVSASRDELRFDGLTFRRGADGLQIWLAFTRGGNSREEHFVFKRAAL